MLRRQDSTPAEASAALDRLIHAEPYESLQAAFDRYDEDGDGELSADEVDQALRSVGVHFSPEQVTAFIRMGNVREDRLDAGTLSEAEFLAMVRRHRRMSLPIGHDTPRGKRMPRRNASSQAAKAAGAVAQGLSAAHWHDAPLEARPPRATRTPRDHGRGQDVPPPSPLMGLRASAAGAVDLEGRLRGVIGLDPIKEKIRALKDTLVKRRFRQEVGAPLVDLGPQHMVFTGNPGVGKTSIARLLARLLFDLGAVRRPAFVEVQRTDLVASHIGQTGPKTRERIEQARGGVLFVDEAYRLTSSSDKDFGREALEEIMKDLTSGDPLVIVAGYPLDMKRFLDANEGLRRRFGMTFDFPDFTVDELARMCLLKIEALGFSCGEGVTREAVAALIEAHSDSAWRAKTNGGVAEKLSRTAMQIQDGRLSPTEMTSSEYLERASRLELSDLEQAAERLSWDH